MPYRRLFLFVEGDDDERFLRQVGLPAWERAYDDVRFVKFSQQKKQKVEGYLRSVKAMGADYVWIQDLDRNPCASSAKELLLRRQSSLDPARVQIVKAEIESWYCAGIPGDDPDYGTLRIATCAETGEVTKEVFDDAIGRTGTLRIPILLSLLERFDVETATRRNGSFRYFLAKFLGGGT